MEFGGNREVRQTVIRVITANLRQGALVSWQGLNFDFTGVRSAATSAARCSPAARPASTERCSPAAKSASWARRSPAAFLHHLIASKWLRRRGALFVIIGRLTFSAAQNTVTAIERETSAIFVGEPTGSRPNFIGERIDFELPYSKVQANAADLFWQTSWPLDYLPWIAPDLYAPPTFESYRRNQDPALDAILAIREHVPG